MIRRLVLYLVVLLYAQMPLSPAVAQTTDDERAALRGLEGVGVVIENVGEEARDAGLRQEAIRNDVELRLRSAGIPILEPARRFEVSGAPYLYVNVNAIGLEEIDHFVYNIEVALNEYVNLVRHPGMQLTAASWKVPDVLGVIHEDDLRDLREDIKDFVDQFANDYLAANSAPTVPFGAATPEGAIREFFSAMREGDYEAMGRFFGTASGPAEHRLGPSQVTQRMTILAQLLSHTGMAVQKADSVAADGDRRTYPVELEGTSVGDVTVPIRTVRAETGRWFVERIEVGPFTEGNSDYNN